MFKKIVVGLDGSEHSDNAVRIACDMGQKYDSEIHLVHTPQPTTVAFALGATTGYRVATTMPSADEVKEAGEKILKSGEEIAKECGQSAVKVHQTRGEPADEIVAYAKDCGADLIVTGRRGLGSIGSLIQGSTSQRIGHLAECACLSVL